MWSIHGYNCEVLIDILCLDCSFLNVRVNLFYLIIWECVFKDRIFLQEQKTDAGQTSSYMPNRQIRAENGMDVH